MTAAHEPSAPTLDITGDVCPMTFVKVKMGLARIPPSGRLNVLLREEALKNVIASLKSEGHKVTRVDRREAAFLLEVERKGEIP
jgi:tRNA 2-thiouridine synthesizing protein A